MNNDPDYRTVVLACKELARRKCWHEFRDLVLEARLVQHNRDLASTPATVDGVLRVLEVKGALTELQAVLALFDAMVVSPVALEDEDEQ